MNDIMCLRERIKVGDIYEHYKGKQYRVIGLSCHSEDLSWYVVYQTLYHNDVSDVLASPFRNVFGRVVR